MKHLLKFIKFESIDNSRTKDFLNLESEIKDILCDVVDIEIGVRVKELNNGDIKVVLQSERPIYSHKFKREDVESSIQELKSQLSDRYDFEFISSLVGNLVVVLIKFKKK